MNSNFGFNNSDVQKKIPSEEDYLYSSARIRVLENLMIGNEKCRRLSESKSTDELYTMLAENGYDFEGKTADSAGGTREKGSENADASESDDLSELQNSMKGENMLTESLKKTFDFIGSIAPMPEIFDVFRYSYDCHNIKSAIKCTLRGTEAGRLLFDFGTVQPELIIKAAKERDFSALPRNMALAAPVALDFYAKTLDPKFIDIVLDRACYEDMSETASKSGSEFIVNLVKMKVDLTNILVAVRIMRQKSASINKDFLLRVLLPGGKLDSDFFISSYDTGTGGLLEKLLSTDYAEISSDCGEDVSASGLELVCENFYMDFVRTVRYKVSGAEVLAAYIIAREYEIKNLRIVIAGVSSGLAVTEIAERLRKSYV